MTRSTPMRFNPSNHSGFVKNLVYYRSGIPQRLSTSRAAISRHYLARQRERTKGLIVMSHNITRMYNGLRRSEIRGGEKYRSPSYLCSGFICWRGRLKSINRNATCSPANSYLCIHGEMCARFISFQTV